MDFHHLKNYAWNKMKESRKKLCNTTEAVKIKCFKALNIVIAIHLKISHTKKQQKYSETVPCFWS